MTTFDKTHDPSINKQLLDEMTDKALDLKIVIQEAEQYLEQCHNTSVLPLSIQNRPRSFSEKIKEKLFRLIAKQTPLPQPTRLVIDPDGKVVPDWKDKLDVEYVKLQTTITTEINVVDCGAVGDGITDCTTAFKRALGRGRVKVIIPPGTYVTKGLRLPSWTYLIGSDPGNTTIKLHDQTPKGTRLITNANHWRGNHHILIEGMSLDWNVERLGDATKTSTWGNHSSCLTYANVTYGWVKNVEGINPGLHCFDVSSTLYNYGGDGYRARGGSQYIWLDLLTGYGFGDDGITTHHSDYIYISECHMCDPSGRAHRKGYSNSNGFEIDDGSRNVLLVNNSSARCFGGIEIKAHENSSAAANVQIIGHISVNDNRSFNFRHIGHHQGTDTESLTAYNIVGVNLVGIAPIFTDLYQDSTPRGLVVSAYKNVVISHFLLLGDPDYDYQGNPLIAIQYRARNIVLNQITFENFNTFGAAIKVFGGENKADSVKIHDCSSEKITVGSDVNDVSINKVQVPF
ncbi:glycosyl hydrolase family 28-related protein [Neobacillus jeddahensis]|uniref:glycosyl hydrolase family 28-related protein n=1 Tax=Neobacillus jeddahensis TaxID=1461580 RepID=UPI00058EF6A7|nr:glycosyl hydrolase family 28-related protein [Neobacillus jeddahensis]